MTTRLSNLDRMLTLVHALCESIEGMTLDEMAQLLGVNRRTVERMRNIILLHFDLDEISDGRIKRFRIRESLRRVYKGHKHEGKAKVYIAHTRGITSPTIKRELRRRNAMEPIIGHTKSDRLLERNHLTGASGDAINAILVAAGHNLRLLVAWLTTLLRALIMALFPAMQPELAAA